MKKLILAIMGAVLLAPALSSAAVLDFSTGIAGVGGTIVDTGGDVVGINILIDNLFADGTAADGGYNIDGLLGCAAGVGASCGALNFDTVAGTFSIVGSVPLLGVGATTLVTGTIDSFTFTPTLGLGVFSVTGTDVKDPGLLTALGLAPGTPFSLAGFSLGFAPVECGEGLTCYSAISTDILNTSTGGAPIPEPATLVLLGGGLLGLARARRRRP